MGIAAEACGKVTIQEGIPNLDAECPLLVLNEMILQASKAVT
jgi:hypothetical protein